jgi:predicted dehydrogenase
VGIISSNSIAPAQTNPRPIELQSTLRSQAFSSQEKIFSAAGIQVMQRREFVYSGAALAALSTLSARAYAAAVDRPRRVGLIGPGWYGKCDLLQLLNVEPVEVVSLCDVDSKMLDQAADLFAARQPSRKRPQTYSDYRQMLGKKELDIVLVDTPDHWHALPMIAAVESGADVWCQKPTAVDVLESKAMLDAARSHKRVVQIGTQRRSTPHLIEAKQRVIDAGLLGNIAHVEVCCYYHMRNRQTIEQAPDKKPPAHLDWEMWTGPATLLPYNDIVHPRGWRAFMEYGNGIVGDMCVHMLDMVRWALDLGWPTTIDSSGGILVDKGARANITDTQVATFHFDKMNVVWTHRSWGAAPDANYPWAAIIYGDKGTLKMSVNSYDFIPQGGGEKLHGEAVIELDQFPRDAEDQKKWALELHVASAIRGHMRDFLKAIDERGTPVADIEQGHISSASCILANLSQRLGRSLAWDPQTHTVVGDEEATALLKRKYRDPWQHPAG